MPTVLPLWVDFVAVALLLESVCLVLFANTTVSSMISADEAEQVFSLNYACYHFAICNFKTAFDLISNDYKFKDNYYDLTKRRLEIRIFFELNEFELCNARNEAFKNYLFTRTKKKKEDNFPATTFDPNNRFVNFVTTLLNLTKHDKAKIKAFYEKIIEIPAVAAHDWFLENCPLFSFWYV